VGRQGALLSTGFTTTNPNVGQANLALAVLLVELDRTARCCDRR